jgi:prefoldin subunit 2
MWMKCSCKTADLQSTYTNYKNTLQQIAQRIGDIEQEAEEHKFVSPAPP